MKIYLPGEERPEPYTVHKKHYWLHMLSGVLVFLAGVGVDILIGELRYRAPHRVRWMSNEITNSHRLGQITDSNCWNSNTTINIEFGVSDDGAVFWRRKSK